MVQLQYANVRKQAGTYTTANVCTAPRMAVGASVVLSTEERKIGKMNAQDLSATERNPVIALSSLQRWEMGDGVVERDDR